VIRVEYKPINVDAIVDATAEVPAVRAACDGMAKAVSASAEKNLRAYNGMGGDATNKLRLSTAGFITTKPVKDFKRSTGTTIPVALATADSKYSAWFEWGHGRRIQATGFMLKAVQSARGRGRWTRWGNTGGSES
jgi:hypothetical protein